MIDFDILSLFCNDSNHSSSAIWIDNDISSCYQKVIFGFFLHMTLLVVVVYHSFQRSACSYRLWTVPLVIIRCSSIVILIGTFSLYFYQYFFVTVTQLQMIDIINLFVIQLAYLGMTHLNLNYNLYHPSNPWSYCLVISVLFLTQNYDFYRIWIKHVTTIEIIYIIVRQSSLALVTLSLLWICFHRCQRRPQSHESKLKLLLLSSRFN